MRVTVMSIVKCSQIAMTILGNIEITVIAMIKYINIYYRKFYLRYRLLKNVLNKKYL